MSQPTRRWLVTWTVRLLLGIALGWGVRVVYERRPLVRFASGLAVRSLSGPATEADRGPHVVGGQPAFFSLDQIMAAEDPAAALREWREAFQNTPKETQQKVLQARAEVSIGSLRQLLVRFAASPALREEMNALLAAARDLGADLYTPDATLRSLLELALLDPGLALDGAQATGHSLAIHLIWAGIAEENPRHVLEAIRSGQAPADLLDAALASLAVRDLAQARAAVGSLPDDQRQSAERALASSLAWLQPLEALSLQSAADGTPDPEWAAGIIRGVPGPQALDFLLALERQHPDLLDSCDSAVTQLLHNQTTLDPGFVLDWLQRRDATTTKDPAGRCQLLAAVGRHDPARAARLLQDMPFSQELGRVISGARTEIFSAWLRREPQAALQWVSEQPNAAGWLSNPDDNRRWVDSVPPEQAPALARWLSEQGLLEKSIDPASDLSPLASLVRPWIQHDPEGAVAWTCSLPAGPARTRAIEQAAAAISRQHGADRSALINQLLASSPDALGPVIAHVDPEVLPLGTQVAEALPRLLDAPFGRYSLRPGIARHLATSLSHPLTRPQVVAALANLPDPAQRQELIQELGRYTESSGSLALARDLASALPDTESARTFIEKAVSQQFNR
jgi:hypothetical protein